MEDILFTQTIIASVVAIWNGEICRMIERRFERQGAEIEKFKESVIGCQMRELVRLGFGREKAIDTATEFYTAFTRPSK